MKRYGEDKIQKVMKENNYSRRQAKDYLWDQEQKTTKSDVFVPKQTTEEIESNLLWGSTKDKREYLDRLQDKKNQERLLKKQEKKIETNKKLESIKKPCIKIVNLLRERKESLPLAVICTELRMPEIVTERSIRMLLRHNVLKFKVMPVKAERHLLKASKIRHFLLADFNMTKDEVSARINAGIYDPDKAQISREVLADFLDMLHFIMSENHILDDTKRSELLFLLFDSVIQFVRDNPYDAELQRPFIKMNSYSLILEAIDEARRRLF